MDAYLSSSQGIGTPSATHDPVSLDVSVGIDHFNYSGRKSNISVWTDHFNYSGNEASFTQNDMFGYRNGGHGLNLNARFYSQ